MSFLIRIGVAAVGVWVATRLVGGLHFDGTIWELLGIALVFGIINALLKPIAIILSLPFIVLTLGLFILIINWGLFALAVWLAGPERLDFDLTADGAGAIFLGALVISAVSLAAGLVIPDDRRKIRRY